MKRNFATLDGMRGLAAAFIVVLHTPAYFVGFRPTEAFLAVDLFFCLSGFVLAHAYQQRFDDGLSPQRFVYLRLVRLYPLYIVGLVLGIVAAVFSGGAGHGGLSLREIGISAIFNGLFLPSPATGRWGEVFPLNGPCWSLFFELAVNVAMALLWRRLSDRNLIAVCVVAGCGLAAIVTSRGDANGGFTWPTLGIGVLRVCFSFFLGMLIYRRRDRITLSLSPWIILAVEGAALFYVPTPALKSLYELAWILVGFPALIAFAVRKEPAHGLAAFRFLGVTSYAVYVLHEPLQRIVRGGLLKIAHRDVAAVAPWGGVVLVGCLLTFAWIVDRTFDAPVRKRLTSIGAGASRRDISRSEQSNIDPRAEEI